MQTPPSVAGSVGLTSKSNAASKTGADQRSAEADRRTYRGHDQSTAPSTSPGRELESHGRAGSGSGRCGSIRTLRPRAAQADSRRLRPGTVLPAPALPA
jgi:hypothetical protein